MSFDADQTLWDFESVMRFGLARVLDELRRLVPVPAAYSLSVDDLVAIRDEAWVQLGATHSLEDVRGIGFERALERVGRPDRAAAEHLTTLYLRHRYDGIQLYPDVRGCLDEIGEHCRIGLVSNGNTDPERCGLSGRFAFVVFAGRHGVQKPDPRLFEIALREAGCRADEMMHVGDSLHEDVGPALLLGMRAAWLNRSGAPNPTGIVPTAEIRTLAELPSLV